MPHRYSTALSHLVLAGTGLYCWQQVSTNTFNYSQGCYGIILLNSILGVWRWGNPDHGDKIIGLYGLTKYLETIFALPFVTTSIWMNYNYMWELSIAHIALSFIALVSHLIDLKGSKKEDFTVDAIICLNVVSLTIVSFLHENYFGITSAISMACNHFILKRECDRDIPPQDLYNYGMCFFAFFTLKALKE